MIADGVTDRDDEFGRFVRLDGERVRRALVAYYGVEIGSEAAAEALAVPWERWDDLRDMANPSGYLYRVGQSQARPHIPSSGTATTTARSETPLCARSLDIQP